MMASATTVERMTVFKGASFEVVAEDTVYRRRDKVTVSGQPAPPARPRRRWIVRGRSSRRSVAVLLGLDRLPGLDLGRQRRIAHDPRLGPLDVEQEALRRAAALQQLRGQVLALDQLLRDVAPADRQMQDAPRRAALVARAAMPDPAIDHRD